MSFNVGLWFEGLLLGKCKATLINEEISSMKKWKTAYLSSKMDVFIGFVIFDLIEQN